jgi:hypothetical protein
VLGTQETSGIVIAGLLERDTFDLFLPEFDKPWVIHLRETCCCSTNLCTWRTNTVYKNRSVRRYQWRGYYHNKRAWSPERDRPNRYNNQKRRSRNEDSHNMCNQVATGYKRCSKEGGERRNSGYHGRDDSGGDISRNFDLSPKDILNGPCHIHYAYVDGKRVSNHVMRDCRTFMKLQEP